MNNVMAEINIYMPLTIEEQKSISAFLLSFDALLINQEQKVKKLEQFRQAMLTKLFPAEGASEPALHFDKSSAHWQRKEFQDMVVRIATVGSDNDLPRVEYEDIISARGRLNKNIYRKACAKTGIVFQAGDVLYGKLRPYLKNWLYATFKGIAVGDFWVLRPQNIDNKFLYYLIQSDAYQQLANQTTGTKMPRADWSIISIAEFWVPELSTQKEIGEFLYQLDKYIAFQEEKLAKLRLLKAALLDKLFV